MTTAALLQAARDAGMAIRVDGDALVWDIYSGSPPGLWNAIRSRKAEMIWCTSAPMAISRPPCQTSPRAVATRRADPPRVARCHHRARRPDRRGRHPERLDPARVARLCRALPRPWVHRDADCPAPRSLGHQSTSMPSFFGGSNVTYW